MPEIDLAGLTTPVLTPFDEQNRLDEFWYLHTLDWFKQSGVRRVLVNGTTSEFFSLTREERRQAFRLARDRFDGVVCYQAGSCSLADTREEALWAQKYGADAVVSLPPYYYAEAPPEGIIDYFQQLGEDLKVPQIGRAHV